MEEAKPLYFFPVWAFWLISAMIGLQAVPSLNMWSGTIWKWVPFQAPSPKPSYGMDLAVMLHLGICAVGFE